MLNEGVTVHWQACDTTRMVMIAIPSEALREMLDLPMVLRRWRSVFSIRQLHKSSQVKFATCTLHDDALYLWNAIVKTPLLLRQLCHAMGT
ncbi:hypothetical protein Tco_0573050 [Tanacetum coccineum]